MTYFLNRIAIPLLLAVLVSACAWFQRPPINELAIHERARIAILPVALKAPISQLANIQTLDCKLSVEEERQEFLETIKGIEKDARWLLESRVATRQAFRFVPNLATDAAMDDWLAAW